MKEPVSKPIRFTRHDGSIVTMSVERGQLPTTTSKPALTADEKAASIAKQLALPVDIGDLVGSPLEPQLIRDTEQIATGQAKPQKAAKQTIPETVVKLHPGTPLLSVLDHPLFGGKVTICVLVYGKYHDLHRRCLNSIVSTVPPSRMDLRIACNQICPETQKYLNTLPYTKLYPDNGSRRKYPAMREMFYDKANPIESNWIIWFDDDSYVRELKWLSTLADTIINQRPEDKVGMLGVKMRHPLQLNRSHDPRKWFKAAGWYRNKPWRNKLGNPSPNGDQISFIVGGFWALSREAMQVCDIPDKRLNHNGGDICIGEQLYQGGFKMKEFNTGKKYIHTSAHATRGYHELPPWYTNK